MGRNIDYEDVKTSVVFLIYLAGGAHGIGDKYFSDIEHNWRRENKLEFDVTGAINCGSHGYPQPDLRVLPERPPEFRPIDDIDPGNDDLAFSRLIWELEWTNRNPVSIRKNGYNQMK